MKNFRKVFLVSVFSFLSMSVFALGSANLTVRNYTNLPGSSFILQSGSKESQAGVNVKIASTTTQCPETFEPNVMTSISNVDQQRSACSVGAIHAVDAQAKANSAGGYDIVMAQVEIDSTGCDTHGLKLNWSIYCMPSTHTG